MFTDEDADYKQISKKSLILSTPNIYSKYIKCEFKQKYLILYQSNCYILY